MAQRKCKAKTKTGKSCRNTAVLEDGYCVAHTPNDADSRRLIGGPKPGAGRPRRPREIELIQEVAEEFKDDLRAVYSDGLTATRSVVVWTGDSAEVEEVPDHAHRLRTAQEIQDRLHGKPRQSADIASTVDVNLNLVMDHELREHAADLRRRLAERRAVKPSGLDARG